MDWPCGSHQAFRAILLRLVILFVSDLGRMTQLPGSVEQQAITQHSSALGWQHWHRSGCPLLLTHFEKSGICAPSACCSATTPITVFAHTGDARSVVGTDCSTSQPPVMWLQDHQASPTTRKQRKARSVR